MIHGPRGRLHPQTCWDFPAASSDPRDYDCPRCHAKPGEPCVSPRRTKVVNSHLPRADAMIRAYNRWSWSDERACQLDGPCSR